MKTNTAARAKRPGGLRKKDWFDYANLLLLTLLMLIVLIPFYYTVIKSFMTEREFVQGGSLLWPREFTFINYEMVFAEKSLVRSFGNTLFNVVVGVAYSMFLTTTLAYGLSKKGYPGRGFFQGMIIFTMYFSGGLIPFFLLVKSLGLMGSRYAIIIPMGLSVFNVVIMRNFFEQLPPDLEEAARIDGAGPVRIFLQIALPLVKPAIATLVLFYAVDRWNEWFHASLFLSNSKLWPVQLQLRQILQVTKKFMTDIPAEAGLKPFSDGLKAAAMVITMVPIMMVYPFLQKYFVKGVMIGAIKS